MTAIGCPNLGGLKLVNLRRANQQHVAFRWHLSAPNKQTTASRLVPQHAVAAPDRPSLLYPNGIPGTQQAASSKTKIQTRQLGVVSEELLDDYRAAYHCKGLEQDYWLEADKVEGKLPADLCGTYMQVSSGIMSGAGRPVSHPADGDGLVTTISVRGGRIFVRSRFVQTAQFGVEKAAGMALFPRQHEVSSSFEPLARLNQFMPLAVPTKHSANASVLLWNKELQVLDQAGSPHRLHPSCLDPLPAGKLQALVAGYGDLCGRHKVLKAADGSERLCLLSKIQLGVNTQVNICELAADGKVLKHSTHVMEECMAAGIHDMAVTDDFFVIVQSSVMLNLEKYVAEYLPGFSSYAACFDFKEDIPAKIHVIPRPGGTMEGQPARIVEAPAQIALQAVNAHVAASGRLVLDVVSRLGTGEPFNLNTLKPEYYTCEELHHPCLRRLTIDLGSNRLVSDEVLSTRAPDGVALEPRLWGHPYRHLYTSASAVEGGHSWGPSQVLAKLQLPATWGAADPGAPFWAQTSELWCPGPRCFTQQPVFLPRGAGWTYSTEEADSTTTKRTCTSTEDDGWVLSMVHDAAAHRSRLCILDAQNFGSGPVCTLHLRHGLPPANHATFVSTYLGPDRHSPANW